MSLFWAGLKNKSNVVISVFPLKRANLCEGKKDVINGLWFIGSLPCHENHFMANYKKAIKDLTFHLYSFK